MLKFNEAINALGLVDIPLKGRKFTWSNMHEIPLLEKLDWFFSSESWTLTYANTLVKPLAKPISDHTPCRIQTGTNIPKSTIFRFENYWLQHQDFLGVVNKIWEQDTQEHDSAKLITAKFKRLRKGLKIWSRSLSNLSSSIKAANELIFLWDLIEEFRNLNTVEINGREIIKTHLLKLLKF